MSQILLRISDIVRSEEFSDNVSMNKTMTLNPQEQERINVLDQHLRGELSIGQVAAVLKCTPRHVYRLKASYREQGAEAMIHGNRGKRSPRRIDDGTRKQISTLAQGRYAGCNQHHVRDLLEERDGIVVSRASVRRILQQEGVWIVEPKKRPKHRLRRPRYRQEGQLIQVDASPHDWLEGRGPRLSVVGGIDDATGKVVGAVFREQEDQEGYMRMLRQVVERYGCPQAIYHDRHSMFPSGKYQVNEKGSINEQLEGKRTDTQLGRLFEQLHTTSIAARSPQAKGRIERLWGTFQDRLVSELRLAGACSIEQANTVLQEYLPRFNARFAVPAAETDLGWQAIPTGLVLDECFCLHDERTVALDNTISYQGQRVQLLATEQRHSFARAKVSVHEHFDGHLSIFWQGQVIPSRMAPSDPSQLRQTAEPAVAVRAGEDDGVPSPRSKAHKPKPDHPWGYRRKSSQAT
jgi:transposase